MEKEVIAFKGVSQGIYLEINGSNMEVIKDKLNKKIKKSPGFYQGTKFLYIEAEDLSPKEVLDIHLILKYKYDFKIAFDDLDFSSVNIEEADTEEVVEEKIEEKPIEELVSGEEMTKFVYRTLRSGQEVEYNGNIVVIGDVNPGAFLKANGNIIVMGSLRGVAHAGLNGNMKSIVAAYQLMPNQLRIGDIIVRAPDDDTSSFNLPEVAKIKNGAVIIEPYLPNK